MSGAIHLCWVCIAVVGISAVSGASARDIYTWQDRKGTTHFSEIPPPMGFSSFEVLEVRLAEPVSRVGQDYRSALELANSLQAARLEREKLRLERDKLLHEERRARLEAERYYDTYQTRYFYGGYYPYGAHPRPPHYGKPHPRPPTAYPPQASYPGSSVPKRVYPGR